jgi:Flp pilus assembly protein protease CpaA
VAKVIEASDPHAAWATMNVKTLINIFLYGLLVGLLTFALYMVLEQFVFEPVLCRESAALARCESKEEFASGVAIVLGSMVGLVLSCS